MGSRIDRSPQAELAAAYAALPDSVSGDAAPAGVTLADRIRALVGERDRYFRQAAYCHARHRRLEGHEPSPLDRRMGDLQDELDAVTDAWHLQQLERDVEDRP